MHGQHDGLVKTDLHMPVSSCLSRRNVCYEVAEGKKDQIGMNGIKKIVSTTAKPNQTRHLNGSSCRGVGGGGEGRYLPVVAIIARR